MKRDEFEARLAAARGAMLRLANLKISTRQDAEDVVQEVVLAWLRAAKSFSGAEHEKAWLIRATINRCRNLVRSRWFRGRRPLTDGLFRLEPKESVLVEAVLELDEKYRLPIHLHYYEGYGIVEIAAMLGEKPATIGTRLARGRERLRQRIGGMPDEE